MGNLFGPTEDFDNSRENVPQKEECPMATKKKAVKKAAKKKKR
jgi:hypothetical protein